MMLDLTPEEADRLRHLLDDYLPDLKREMSRTEEKTLRHELVLREELLERIIARLGGAPAEARDTAILGRSDDS